MRNTRDTFLHYLADNLEDIPVHPLRFDKDNPGGELIQGNALNVQFFNSTFTTGVNEQLVTLDICHDNELTALDWANQVAALLLAAAYVKKLDYSSGTGVDAQDGWIYWNPRIVFRAVEDMHYHRFTANLKLFHK